MARTHTPRAGALETSHSSVSSTSLWPVGRPLWLQGSNSGFQEEGLLIPRKGRQEEGVMGKGQGRP